MAEGTGYIPGTGPFVEGEESQALLEWVQRELEAIAMEFQEVQYVRLTELHVAPEKPRDGDIVYADGTDWDPGSGEGFYGREGGSWTKL